MGALFVYTLNNVNNYLLLTGTGSDDQIHTENTCI